MRILFAAALLATPALAHAADLPAGADGSATAADDGVAAPAPREGDGIPDQLDSDQKAGYRKVFAALHAQRWQDAQLQLDSMKPGPLHAIARAELYTAKNSPKVELAPLLQLIGDAPELPQADQLSRMARTRGAMTTPAIPAAARLIWYDGAPVRQRARSIKSDTAATEIALAIQPYVKADQGAEAEGVVARFEADLTPEARTEWQQKVAWIYYVAGDDDNARRVAAKAQDGAGDWAPQADWVAGLAAWREQDCAGATAAFERVATRAADTELRSAGLYWGSRAEMACGRPDKVATKLRAATQYGETFYGLLARSALGIEDKPGKGEKFVAEDWRALERRPNVRVAAALVEIDEDGLADEVLRYQAKIGNPSEHLALTRLAGRLSLPSTQLWLTHNCPQGTQPLTAARYPAPNWTPAGGWRVDKALVFAHTLQESRFNSEIRSAAGAMGLMQVKTGAAIDIGRRNGRNYAASDLTKPSVNMEIGQSYLEQLRDQPFTGGLLPKVIASYNAGPTPVANWNAMIKDGGDPLLYIESIPYWETRGYVMTVLRNYWMYENQEGRKSSSREALAQGMWPKFPGMQGPAAVKLSMRKLAFHQDGNANR
ncbi:lytic transglycosylase domain-containing protein [Nostoc ellipsosporum NOK]|uniref:lytic transglycosylase domain-containing protein n=1 Tax=Sphingomonas sp. IBVSS2 TaxID=1985172 RepID=UPI000A2D033A|nr:lytic transglycosylase domain-containing protein [Sphingomonas sp. IBVSS2]MDF2382381.1 lytic transglycosylase domain-containing protein [Nostoc ellipsosporum NOK]OSZ66385.1 lytic transglycosylase [Sphingomonas sp. IBVSS2]